MLVLTGLKYLCNTSERKQGGLIITGGEVQWHSLAVDAGGTKVLLRHRKDRIVLSKGYERKILVYVVVVMFIT